MPHTNDMLQKVEQLTLGSIRIHSMVNPSYQHYTLYQLNHGQDDLITSWNDCNRLTRLSMAEIIAEAYYRVFMWIRPQVGVGQYIDNLDARQEYLKALITLHRNLYGRQETLCPSNYIYHDRRHTLDGVDYQLFRQYIAKNNQLKSVVMAMSNSGQSVINGPTTMITHQDADIDPGDFIDGLWTPSLRDVHSPL